MYFTGNIRYKPESYFSAVLLTMREFRVLESPELLFSSDSGFRSGPLLLSTSVGIFAASEPTVNTNRQTTIEFIVLGINFVDFFKVCTDSRMGFHLVRHN